MDENLKEETTNEMPAEDVKENAKVKENVASECIGASETTENPQEEDTVHKEDAAHKEDTVHKEDTAHKEDIAYKEDAVHKEDTVHKDAETETEPKKKTSIKLSPKLMGVLTVIIAALVVLFCVCKFTDNSKNSGGKVHYGALKACLDEDKTAYVPLMDGGEAEFEDVSEAYITPDRKHIVVLGTDDTIFVTDAKQKKRVDVTDDGESLVIVKDKGFIYRDGDYEYYRYLFDDGSSVSLGKVSEIQSSTEELNISFIKDKAVYLLKQASEEVEKLGNFDNSGSLLSMSDDGETVYWNEYSRSKEEIFAYIEGEKTKIGTFERGSKNYTSTAVIQNAAQSYAIIVNSYAEKMFIVQGAEEPIEVKLGGKLNSNYIYTNDELVERDKGSKFTGVYVSVAGDEGANLYYINKEGKRKKVVSDIGKYLIYKGKLFHVDENDNLKSAKVSEDSITKEEKITGGVEILEPVCTNGYIYFIKDVNSEDETGSLYVSKNGGEPERISSDVSVCVLDVIDFKMLYATTSLDGKTIYYYKDMEEIPDTYTEMGDLYKYSYGAGDSEKIASEVILFSPESGALEGVDNKSFIYKVYSSKDKNDDVLIDWYHFNGSESNIMASEVVQ